ncbi:MAG: LysR family transcriptional regulator [Pseudomonadota bacterium]
MDRLVAMQVFVEVAECGSMTAAAAQLDMSRAMVSRYLESLEDWLGARLLHRTTRHISLTDAGLESLDRCRSLLLMTEEVKASAGRRQLEPQGQIRITASNSLAESHLAAAIAEFVQLYPKTRIDILALDRTVNLVEERMDLAIRITNQLDPALLARRLSTCRSLLCASPAYLARRGTPIDAMQLEQHLCLTHSYVGKTDWELSLDGKLFRPSVEGPINGNEASVLLHAAIAGAGITIQPTYLATPYLLSGALVQVLPEYQPQEMGIYVVYTSRQHQPLIIRTLIDFLAQRFSEPPYWDIS